MNKNFFNIKYVAKLFNISESKIRYWESKNLINTKRQENGYRYYTLRDIVNLADIISYRHLNIKIKDIPRLTNCSIIEQKQYINDYIRDVNNKLNYYYKVLDKLNNKNLQIDKLIFLKNNEYILENINFKTVIEFDIHNQKLIQLYSKNTSLYIRYYNSTNLEIEKRGIIVNQIFPEDKILWTKQKSNNQYLVFHVIEKVEKNYESNLSIKLNYINKEYKTGVILLEYLTTSIENNELIDNYKAYVEIIQ